MSTEPLFIVKYAHRDSAPMCITELVEQVKYGGLDSSSPAKLSDSEEWSTVESLVSNDTRTTRHQHSEEASRELVSRLHNEHTSHFKSNDEWYEYIRPVWPFDLNRSHLELLEINHPIWNDVNFQIGCLRYYLEHGGENQLIDENCRDFCMGAADRLVTLVRLLGWSKVDEYYTKHLNYINTYRRGITAEVLGDSEITKLMKTHILQ
jgi:hypothetical protein